MSRVLWFDILGSNSIRNLLPRDWLTELQRAFSCRFDSKYDINVSHYRTTEISCQLDLSFITQIFTKMVTSGLVNHLAFEVQSKSLI